MSTRPIALLGGEKLEKMLNEDKDEFKFDSRTGVWRDDNGGLAVHNSKSQSTKKTATREGIDQTEGIGGSTRITETREGIDQTERAN